MSPLSYDRGPPLSLPLRFFLTAPPLALAGCTLLAWAGADAFSSRWSPVLLAVTHLLTIGFLAMNMIGALLQIIAVTAAATTPSEPVAAATHWPLAAGAVLLAAGFTSGAPTLLQGGAALLAFGFAVAIVSIWHALSRAAARGAMAQSMRIALTGLAVTVVLGATLALALARGWALPAAMLTDLHLQWGMLGWVLLLVCGVAAQVVPMFQATPEYPSHILRVTAWTVCGALTASAIAVATVPGLQIAAKAVLAVATAVFAAITLRLQARRRRRQPDATLLFWQCGMWSLLAAVLLWLCAQVRNDIGGWPGYGMLLGVLAVYGFATSVISGMLCKIAPFLAWLHMQSVAHRPRLAPGVKKILPDAWCRWHWRLHVASLVLLIAATVRPGWFVRPAAVLAALSFLILWCNILHTCRVHRDFVRDIRSRPGAVAPAL